ncbi:helix-turn-helix domain-containing protein [Nocardia sp. NRRL S-836]|uniref:winged helix-turn-helix transcriptional regulator n=1 Tax=Nocardia sp. NRRL S-836 TaxID=1519492 RepID=UPI0006AEA4F8|nr:helix-turn-helix domain-containing protein [Nocardia sp. NRRL S-836]KOV81451.1 HxlR family transcriptional regulator [Nocardia sp. NRRL S-836]
MAPRTCSIANALEVIGERWSLLALREVFFGNHRFDQIAANTGASRDVLAARLKKLVAAGVLERCQYSEHPPRHEYVLTDSGRSLHNVMLMLKEWGDAYVTEGPLPLVWEHSCGNVLEPRVVCAHCGEEATPESLTRSAATPGDPISVAS